MTDNGIENALEYMTSGYTYFSYLGNEHYLPVGGITENQMNIS